MASTLTGSWHLSPYCVFHPEPDGRSVALTHAVYGSRFTLTSELFAALGQIVGGAPLQDLLADQPELAEVLEMLVEEHVLVPPDELRALRDGDPFRNRLGPVEMAVHRGFNEGGWYPEHVDPGDRPPSTPPAREGPAIELDTPSFPEPLLDVVTCLERRRSIRGWSQEPLAKADLERFLHLTVRAHALMDVPEMGELTLRNFAGGGARYPLEAYLLVRDVEGVEAGLYHYHALHHRLERLPCEAEHAEGLEYATLSRMGDPTRMAGRPAVHFLLTAVVARVCWKYEGVPYQLILQETGTLYQTMYLAATALGLAPCAIGAFPERAVAEILGCDVRDEMQVGLFALGVPASDLADMPEVEVRAVRLREGSPLSADPRHRAVEIELADGRSEIRALDQVWPIERPDGRFEAPALRGRCRAVFGPAEAATLEAWRE